MTPSDMHALMLRLQWLPHSKPITSLALSEGHARFDSRTAADNLPIVYIAPASHKPEHDDGDFTVATTTGRVLRHGAEALALIEMKTNLQKKQYETPQHGSTMLNCGLVKGKDAGGAKHSVEVICKRRNLSSR